MFDGTYLAEREQGYRQAVLYPAAARRAKIERELRQLSQGEQEHGGRRRRPARRLGKRLVQFGLRLRGPVATPPANA